MGTYNRDFQEEAAYLETTLACIRETLRAAETTRTDRKRSLRNAGREIWEETSHSTADLEQLLEALAQMPEVTRQTYGYASAVRQADKYRRMIDSPYFGRFDLVEEGLDLRDRIYVGLGTVIEPGTQRVLVYDWRAPISGIFYQFEPGPAFYEAPVGTVSCEVLLKRQYKIRDSKLKYFFDCSIRIGDELLQEVLAGNASPRMKSIVETIQKEQDLAIRDTTHDLLIVQGVAGSGKTSIALHRIAFLLYTGMGSHLAADNVCIVSPNTIFSSYVSSVLPELGEENVAQITFDELGAQLLGDRVALETRAAQLEALVANPDRPETAARRREIEFKGSAAFVSILDRLMRHLQHRMIPFEDVCFAGKIIRTRQQLKSQFLSDQIGLPIARRLKRMERILMDAIHPLQKERLERIEAIVRESEDHQFEVKPFSRLLAFKLASRFTEHLHRFLEVDYFRLYQALFADQDLFFRLAKGLDVPGDIHQMLTGTRDRLKEGRVNYEDCAPLMYLKLRIEGSELFRDIRHVVIDEAQDYLPVQYEVFKLAFNDPRYTVLGDVNQALGRDAGEELYDEVATVLGKHTVTRLNLTRSYRSSFEISAFARRLLSQEQPDAPFERHEAEPVVMSAGSEAELDRTVAKDAAGFLAQGYASVAVICKTGAQAQTVQSRLAGHLGPVTSRLMTSSDQEIGQGIIVTSTYAAKGLEFDAVLVYGVDGGAYHSDFDRRLLYVACTRALHRLALYHTGERSPLLCP